MTAARFTAAFAAAGAAAGGLAGWAAGALSGEAAVALGAGVGAALFLFAGWLAFYRGQRRGARARARVLGALASGDLAPPLGQERNGTDPAPLDEVMRVVHALRRAVSQMQRAVTGLRALQADAGERTVALVQLARRQASAVDRALGAVEGMGLALGRAGESVAQLEQQARDSADALARLADGIEKVGATLQALDDFAAETIAQLDRTAAQTRELAGSTRELSRFAVEADAFAGEVAASGARVRRRAEETFELASQVRERAERGGKLVGDTVAGLYRIDETVRRAAEVIEGLGRRSEEIGRIVDVIEEVADRTQVLALNAAVAAASGERGAATTGDIDGAAKRATSSHHAEHSVSPVFAERGFAAVADAVRALAERASRATREIVERVAAVQADVESAVKLAQEGRASAAAGVQLGERAASALAEIRDLAQRTHAAVETTIGETERLSTEGGRVAEASRAVAARVEEVGRAAAAQADEAGALAERTREVQRLAQGAQGAAEEQARTGRGLSRESTHLLGGVQEIRRAHEVLTAGDERIRAAVAGVREGAGETIRVADTLSRGVELLAREAGRLEAEVFRFKLPAPRPGGTLRVGVPAPDAADSSHRFDPIYLSTLSQAEIAAAMYRGLVRAGEGAQIVPDLAESWTVDAEARHFRFRLRPNLRFHDGSPVDAVAVVRALERLRDPALQSPGAWVMEGVESLRATGERELEIDLHESKAFFLYLLTHPHAFIGGPDPTGQPNGTGPFRVVEIRAGDSVVLQRAAEGRGAGAPYLEGLVVRFGYHDRGEVLQDLLAGRLDCSAFLPREAADEAAELGGGLVMLAGPELSTGFIGFNCRLKPFDDVRVRRAFRAALDVAALLEGMGGEVVPARGLLPPGLLAHDASLPLPETDPALARRLLAEAGLSAGAAVPFTLLEGDHEAERQAQVLFRGLPSLGVSIEWRVLPPRDYWRVMRAGEVAFFSGVWLADYPDPDNFLYVLCNSAGQQSYNFGYANPEVDRLTREARAELDPEARIDLYRRAERVVLGDAPLVPLFHDRSVAGHRAHVHGARLYLTPPVLRPEDIWLEGA
jgi:ABC-type transport system substrate-binding protein